jgi:hypothetical protein
MSGVLYRIGRACSGHPPCTFTGDSRPGATSGQGLPAFGASWHVLTPPARR